MANFLDFVDSNSAHFANLPYRVLFALRLRWVGLLEVIRDRGIVISGGYKVSLGSAVGVYYTDITNQIVPRGSLEPG